MKHQNKKQRNCANQRQHYIPYPNAATPGYYWSRVLDGVLSVVTGMGTITILFFLITM